jgi:autotransporter passenger strand-loop-strand repeat protein
MTMTIISSGVTSSGLTVSNGKEVYIESGGTTTSTTVLAGGSEDPAPGGLAHDVTVSKGGYLIGRGDVDGTDDIYGTINGVTLVYRGYSSHTYSSLINVHSGARALDLTLDSGAYLYVSQGASLSGATINSSGVIWDAGVHTGGTISAGGREDIFTGGSGFNLVVMRGGSDYVEGYTSGTLVSGGVETVQGVADATVLSSGSYEYDYGVTSATVVLSGAHEVVASVGTASGSVISNGGRAAVMFSGVAVAPTVLSGGTLLISEGGKIVSGLTIAGGEVILSGLMASGQTVSFTGPTGVLDLALPSEPVRDGFFAQISGMNAPGRKVELSGFAFSSTETASWAQSGASGTLTVSDGARLAFLNVLGTYAGGDFHLTDDGHGGTYVFDQPTAPAVIDGRAAGFAQAAAGFRAPENADIAIHAGGTVTAAPTLVTAAISSR